MRCKMRLNSYACLLVLLTLASSACNKADDGGTQQAATDNQSVVHQATHAANEGAAERASQADFRGAAGSNAADSQQQPLAPPATTPAEAVTNFLEAVRRGDDGQAEALLTDLARMKTREMDLAVAPPGSTTAQFDVTATEFPYEEQNIAHVASTWSDIDDSGRDRSDEIVWILRRENAGWRIAGMATKLFDDQPPLILNFEDPEDMIAQEKAAKAEIDRRNVAEKAAENAGQGLAPSTGRN